MVPAMPQALLPVDFDDPPRDALARDGLGTFAPEAVVDPRALEEPCHAPERIARTLRAAGIDAPGSLYNEALELAKEGHLGLSMGRLQMLLGLDPEDVDGLLLAAKVLAAQGKATEALARLDAAVAAGGLAPAGLRDHLEGAIRVERGREEEHRARLMAREQGEIKALRGETRQLRSENVRIEAEYNDVTYRERMWKLATFGTALFATGVVLALALLPAGGVSSARAGAEVVPAAVMAQVVVDAPLPNAPVAPKVSKVVKAAPVVSAGGQVHEVASGDTLYKLAKRYYGDAERWEEIRDANKAVLTKGIDLTVGTKITIP